MNHAQIEERQLVDRYLMGRLPAAEVARFEEHYLGCQRCLDELEAAERMQGAARRTASEDASRLAAARGLAVVAWLARRRYALPLAAVAVAVLALLPAAFLLRQPAAPGSPGAGVPDVFAPQAGTPIVLLRPERGGGPDVAAPSLQLDLPRPPRWLVFRIELEPPLASSYRLVLRHGPASEERWRAEELEPDASGHLSVSFHSSFFEDGDYLLVADAVTPAGGTVLVGRHPFRVAGASSP